MTEDCNYCGKSNCDFDHYDCKKTVISNIKILKKMISEIKMYRNDDLIDSSTFTHILKILVTHLEKNHKYKLGDDVQFDGDGNKIIDEYKKIKIKKNKLVK